MKIHHTLLLLFALTVFARDDHQKGQYKKQNRDVVTQVAKGDAEAGLSYAKKYLKKYPKDVEADYIAVLAHAKLEQYDAAIAVIQRSLGKGLPFARYQAGPRNMLAGLYATPGYQALAAKHGSPLVHGPLLGAVTANSANIWLRTSEAATVTVQIGDQTFRGKSSPETDFTAVVAITGLQASTDYSYQLQIGDSQLSDTYPFRSAPAAGKPAKFRIGFGGGAGYTPWREHMWTTIADAKLQAFLLLGDNVYIDTPQVRETQRYCYYRRQSQPAFRHFAARTSVHAIWDDHDFGGNDCTSSLSLDSPPWKRDVRQVFTQNWGNPNYGLPDAPGIWHRLSVGDVDFFMLDCRFYRQNPKEVNNPSMLGPAQLAWLKRELRNSSATFKVICSAVPMTPGTKGSSRDTWDGFPAEREAIFRHVSDAGIDGVFIIAADRHRSDAWRINRLGSYSLYEFMSSRLTNIHSHKLLTNNPACLFGYGPNAYGRLVFDTTLPDPEVTYEIVNIDGEVPHRHTLTRSELQNGK